MTECAMPFHAVQTLAKAKREYEDTGLPSMYVARCSHFEGRGVVELRWYGYGDFGHIWVDYVQWEPEFLCEAGPARSEEAAAARWLEANERMLAGDPPIQEQ